MTYRFAHLIDVSVEWKLTINGGAETSNALSDSDRIGAKCNNIDYTFRSESRSSADDDSLWFIGVQRQTIYQCLTATKQPSKLIVELVFSRAV